VRQRWSARGLHAPTLSFSVSARVGHGPLFLVSAGGRKGFRRSAVTGVVFLYCACCSRAGAGEFFRRRLLDVFCLFVVVFSLFFSLQVCLWVSDITGLFLGLVLPGSVFSSLEIVLKCRE
jgi:hypothetical protein